MVIFELLTRHITGHLLENIREMVKREFIGENVVVHMERHKFDRVQICDSDIIGSLVTLPELTLLT